MSRHNLSAASATSLTLSAVARSERDGSDLARRCARCGNPLPTCARPDAAWCSAACRQAAFRARRAGRPVAKLAPSLGRISAASAPIVDIPLARRAQDRESLRARAEPRPIARLAVVPAVHEHSPRLCVTCTTERYLELRPAPRAKVSAELVARLIARDPTRSVWPAVLRFGISYSHAAAIRAGFRGAGREAPGIAYRSRGWYAGRRNGWSTRSLRVLEGGAVRVARSAS